MSQSTVLIVEDEPEVAELLEFNLQATGFRTLTAHDGLTACRAIGDQQPDLVLLDLLLPDLTGWEICRMIRGHADPAVSGLPIVMLTALASVSDKLRGLELGADDYIAKPFAVREVVLKVQNMLSRTKETQEVARQLRRSEAGRESQLEFQNLLFHELKNKLVVIGGFANQLASKPVADERGRRYAQVILETSSYLGTLAEEVLLLRRVENGVLSLPAEELDLNELAQVVASFHRESAEERGIRLRLDGATPGRTALGNELAVRVCLSNLVENAVRYSPRDTTVVVRTGGNQERVFLEVDDEGPGIPGRERDLIFERFYRGRAAQGVAGTGLGLYIVRTLARAMGGEATLTDRPTGTGTRVRVDLPGRALG
ncbi:MAG: hybrid sensor histidine kinase/response regulator [Deferrisomatales bacterium]|nr:hybrid sensor histidine kinase/response regulator [Deferrisomatales bacterium]